MPEKRTTRELPVPLTAEEKSTLGEALAHTLTERELVYAAKREAVSKHNEKIKILDKEVTRQTRAIETGHEFREVECVERPGLTNGTVEIVRLDTGEVLETITDDPEYAQELAQQELPLARPGKACSYCGNADGTHRAGVPHGYARTDADTIVPLTAGQRDGLEEELKKTGDVQISVEGELVTVVEVLADEPEDPEDDFDDDGAEAIAQLSEEDLEQPAKKPAKGKGKKANGAAVTT